MSPRKDGRRWCPAGGSTVNLPGHTPDGRKIVAITLAECTDCYRSLVHLVWSDVQRTWIVQQHLEKRG